MRQIIQDIHRFMTPEELGRIHKDFTCARLYNREILVVGLDTKNLHCLLETSGKNPIYKQAVDMQLGRKPRAVVKSHTPCCLTELQYQPGRKYPVFTVVM